MADVLASKMTQAVVRDMTVRGTIKDGKPSEEQSSQSGPWAFERDFSPAQESRSREGY